jgi:hypothetical protein
LASSCWASDIPVVPVAPVVDELVELVVVDVVPLGLDDVVPDTEVVVDAATGGTYAAPPELTTALLFAVPAFAFAFVASAAGALAAPMPVTAKTTQIPRIRTQIPLSSACGVS